MAFCVFGGTAHGAKTRINIYMSVSQFGDVKTANENNNWSSSSGGEKKAKRDCPRSKRVFFRCSHANAMKTVSRNEVHRNQIGMKVFAWLEEAAAARFNSDENKPVAMHTVSVFIRMELAKGSLLKIERFNHFANEDTRARPFTSIAITCAWTEWFTNQIAALSSTSSRFFLRNHRAIS